MRQRPADPDADRERLLDMHCECNYACEPTWARDGGWEAYRAQWLASGQPEAFLSDLARSLADSRTLAEIGEEEPGGPPEAYLWVRFSDIAGYGLTVAEVADLWVAPGRRRQGLGTALLTRAAAEARARGAACLRSGTGAGNSASMALHARLGFAPYRHEFELRWSGP